MAKLKFDQEITALLVIDPYNDFISEGGKVWDRLKTVAEANNCLDSCDLSCQGQHATLGPRRIR
jgi:hypothetical protein